jgi:hypothetical protein
MIKRLILAGALIAMALMRAYGQNEFNTAGDLVDTFNRGGDILRLRAYIKGVGDGLQFSNAELAHEKAASTLLSTTGPSRRRCSVRGHHGELSD